MEVYVAGTTNRFVTITCNVLQKLDIAENLDGFHESYLNDESIIEKAMLSKQGHKFSKLWNGDISDYPSHSEADLALTSILAFYCNGN